MAITSKGLEQLGFVPQVDYSLRNNSDGNGIFIKEWNNASPQPSESEIEAAHNEWQAEYDSQEYARNRATEYAPIGDQLDMQYWDEVNGTTTWKDHIADVKAAHPK